MSFLPKSDRKDWLYFCAVILIGIFSLRSFNVGVDTKPYIDYFLGKRNQYYMASFNRIDHQFLAAINYILRAAFFKNGTLYLLFISTLFVIPYTLLVRKYSRNGIMSFVFFMVFTCFIVYMIAIRQIFSLGFLLWGLFFFDSKVRGYIILTPLFVAAGFVMHFASILIIVFCVLSYFVKINNKIAAVLLISSSVIGSIISRGDYVGQLIAVVGAENGILNRAELYSEWFNERYSLLHGLNLAFVPTILVYFANKRTQETIFFRCFVFGEMLFLLGANFMMIERSVIGLIILGTIIMPNVLKKPRELIHYIPWFVIAYYIIKFITGFLNFDYKEDLTGLLPYTFIFQ